MAKRGIGRGLAAILPETAAAGDQLRDLPVEMIRPNASQPRRQFSAESISALAESISAAGIIQPLLVHSLPDGTYELIAGERRWRAAREAGLATVPALLRDEGEHERLQTALIENVAREDLNPVDDARACAALVDDLGVSKEDLARRLGRSRAALSNLIRLLDLPDEALALLEAGELSEGHGRAILQARGNDARRKLAREAAARGWSVRETERRAKAATTNAPKPAPHPDQQAALQRVADALEEAFGQEFDVRLVRGEIRAELRFADLREALAFASVEADRRAA
jgi:ParB family chromosome partitioning protein